MLRPKHVIQGGGSRTMFVNRARRPVKPPFRLVKFTGFCMLLRVAAPTDTLSRRVGMIFLIVASAMVILGQTLLSPFLRGIPFILYWLACFVVTGMAMLAALLEARTISRQAREQHREMVARALDGLPDVRPDTKPPAMPAGDHK